MEKKKNTLQQEVLRCSWTRTEMFWERGSKSLVVYCRSSITHPMPSTILGKVYNKSSSRAEQCWHKATLWQFSILTVILAGCQMVIVIWRLRGSTMGKSRTYWPSKPSNWRVPLLLLGEKKIHLPQNVKRNTFFLGNLLNDVGFFSVV